ncbi:MAG: dTDP-4-dehydrorhamnose reductase [Colwellia sp.]|nr:dTDP-4-dehydrorhamnose reductase [Colwellia sp.]
MKIIVIGKSGQLAWEISKLSGEDAEILCLGREEINITDKASLLNQLSQQNVSAIINASAYTAVDKAETDSQAAYNINTHAVENLALVCKELSIHLVHVSTDFVFDGNNSSPYLPLDHKDPIGVYGKSKSDGEDLINQVIPNDSCIIRTSWVYSSHGNNFVKTMLKLMNSKPELGIISDQIGTPTYAKGLAQVCLYAAINKVKGIQHWTDTGVASWYDFAVAIQELALEKGLLHKAIPIKPIRTADYPTPAKRPSYSVLDKTSIETAFPELSLVHWRTQLSLMMNDLKINDEHN